MKTRYLFLATLLGLGSILIVSWLWAGVPVTRAQPPAPAPELEISPVMKNYDDGQQICTSIYTVTNESTYEGLYSHDFYDSEQGGSVIYTLPDTISGLGTAAYDLADIAPIPDGYRGRVVILATEPFTVTLVSCTPAESPPPPIYLPVIVKNAGPPSAPVLDDISNPDGDGNYTVSWSAVNGATSYTLEEDDNAAFSSPTAAYSGSGTSKSITGKDVGTYYYRVKASNDFGSSDWSGIKSVVVFPPPPCLPQLGNWTGQESEEGYPVSFTVTSECKVHRFKIKVPFGPFRTCQITVLEDLPIDDNNFSFDFLGGDISGQFDSSTSASGTYYVFFCENTLIIPASEGTWEAHK